MEDTGLTRLRAVLYTARVSLFAVLCQPSERMDDDTTHLQGAAHVHPPIIGALLLLAGCVVLRRMLAVPITAGIRRSTARPARNSSQQKPAAASPAAEGAPHAPAPRRLQEGGHGRQHGRRLEGAVYHNPSALIVMAQQASVAVQHTQPGTAASRSQLTARANLQKRRKEGEESPFTFATLVLTHSILSQANLAAKIVKGRRRKKEGRKERRKMEKYNFYFYCGDVLLGPSSEPVSPYKPVPFGYTTAPLPGINLL